MCNPFLIVGRNIITVEVGEIFTLNQFKNLFASYSSYLIVVKFIIVIIIIQNIPFIFLSLYQLILIIDGSKSYVNSLVLEEGP